MSKRMMNVRENACESSDYSIHTVEIGIRLSRSESLELREKLKTYRRKYYDKEIPETEGCHRVTEYKYIRRFFEKGISKLRVEEHYVDKGFVCGNVFFKLNPRLLLGYTDYKSIAIVPVGELENVMPELIRVWGKYLSAEIVKRAMLTRVDFCANIKMDNQKQAERFMKLLSQAKEPAGLKYKKYYSKSQHRKLKNGNGITITSKYCEISIYLKQKQMLYQNQHMNGGHSEEEIQLADGQIRFELRIKRRKIHYMSERYLECTDTDEFLKNAAMLSKMYLEKYLRIMYGSGRFVKMSGAQRIIMANKRLHMDTRRSYICLLEAVNEVGQDEYFENLRIQDKKAYDTAVRWRKEINDRFWISLITMPESWPEEYFENPLFYIKNRNVNERK